MKLSLGDVVSLATRFASRSDFSTSEVSLLANMALTEVQNRLYHTPKEAYAFSNLTGAGNERRVAVPTDFDGVIGIKFYSTSTNTAGVNVLGDEVDLAIVDSTLLDSFSSTTATAPERYSLYGGFIELDPIPGSRGSLVMRYLAKQETLVQLTETPALDERWHQGWLWKTTELVNLARGNATSAADAERRYVNYMLATPGDRATGQMAKKGLGLWVRKS